MEYIVHPMFLYLFQLSQVFAIEYSQLFSKPLILQMEIAFKVVSQDMKSCTCTQALKGSPG